MQWKDGHEIATVLYPRVLPFHRWFGCCQLSTGESIKLMSENLNTIVVGVRVCGRELCENMGTAPLYCYITSYYNYLR